VWCCDLDEMSENPVTTFPIKKRSNTELFIDEWAALYIQDGVPKLSGEFEEGKCWRHDQQ